MNLKVFYSWQSDLPNNVNRGAIQNAILDATKSIHKNQIDIELNLDRDTKDAAGSPDIVDTILRKIKGCDIFIADISIINSGEGGRKTPNPNVLIELGYAAHRLSWDNLILVFNRAYGDIDDLPFDLRGRRVLVYDLRKPGGKKELSDDIRKAIEAIVKTIRSHYRIRFGHVKIDGSPSKEVAEGIIRQLKHFVQIKPLQSKVRMTSHESSNDLYVAFAVPSILGAATAGMNDTDGGWELIASNILFTEDDVDLEYDLYSSNSKMPTTPFQVKFHDIEK